MIQKWRGERDCKSLSNNMHLVLFCMTINKEVQYDNMTFNMAIKKIIFSYQYKRLMLYPWIIFSQGSPHLKTYLKDGSCLTFYRSFSYILFIFYFFRFTLLDFPSISSSWQDSLPFLSCHRTRTTRTRSNVYGLHSLPKFVFRKNVCFF